MNDLRRVWITGASEGIGRATALAFARQGAAIALCARRNGPLEATADALRDEGAPRVVAVQADIGDPEDLERFATEAARLGGCDVLVHNAAGGGPATFFELDDQGFEADWAYAFAVNLMAPARLARRVAPLLEASSGVIIHVSSAWSRRPMAMTPASYGATKAGLNHLTVTLARELGPKGIRVVGVAPGPIWTETWERDLQERASESGAELETLRAATVQEAGSDTALGRPGQMDEIATAIAWLASPAASYITGTTLAVDGGYLAR